MELVEMILERALLSTREATQLASHRLLIGVLPHVDFEVVCMSECLPTLGAAKLPLTYNTQDKNC